MLFRSPHGANISNGTPTPQHTVQLSFPSPAAPAQTLQAPPPIPSNSSTVPSAAQVSSVQYSNGLLVNMQHWKLHQLGTTMFSSCRSVSTCAGTLTHNVCSLRGSCIKSSKQQAARSSTNRYAVSRRPTKGRQTNCQTRSQP